MKKKPEGINDELWQLKHTLLFTQVLSQMSWSVRKREKRLWKSLEVSTGKFLVADSQLKDGVDKQTSRSDFLIENIVDGDIRLLDHTSQIIVENCTNSRIFIGEALLKFHFSAANIVLQDLWKVPSSSESV